MADDDVYTIMADEFRPPAPKAPSPSGRETHAGRRSNRLRAGAQAAVPAGNPRAAASLSLWVSGAGQALHGDWKSGSFYFLVLSFGISFHYLLRKAWQEIVQLVGVFNFGESEFLIAVVILDLFLGCILLSGIHHAYSQGELLSNSPRNRPAHPLAAAAASALIPGWGQIVNGQIRKAMVFLFLFLTEMLAVALWFGLREPVRRLLGSDWELERILFTAGPVGVVWLLGWALGFYDAILVAIHRREMAY